ncbi:MAG: hypothetical protein ACREMY_12045 [bacterium]
MMRWTRFGIFVLAATLSIALGACAGTSTALPAAPAITPTETSVPTAAPSVAAPSVVIANSPAVSPGTCVISIPEQYGTDLTPVVIEYPSADEAACAGYLAKQNTGTTGWSAAHPATRITGVPTGPAACDLIKGLRIIVFGTGAATLSCQALKK